MQYSQQQVLFIFLSYEDRSVGDTIKVLHSLLFQLLEEKPAVTFRPALQAAFESNNRKLRTDPEFVKDLLCDFLKSLGSTSIVLDGLDELEDFAWKHLLSTLVQIQKNCPQTKLLISSREVREISLRLEKEAVPLSMANNNLEDIRVFVQAESEELLLEVESYGANVQTCSKIKKALDSIPTRSQGMFLYAKLVMYMVKDHRTLRDIEIEIGKLPDGLDQA